MPIILEVPRLKVIWGMRERGMRNCDGIMEDYRPGRNVLRDEFLLELRMEKLLWNGLERSRWVNLSMDVRKRSSRYSSLHAYID
jgi:hypothetical protein